MKNDKISDASKAGFGLLIDSILEVSTDSGAEIAKESISHLAGELAIDSISSFIPGVNGAINTYRRVQSEKNLRTLIYHLNDHYEELISNLNQQTKENREKLDKLLQFILEIVTDEYQEEKIEYMANGYLFLTKHDEITSDFVMHYYDMLKQLRMVDISVLQLYYKNSYLVNDDEERETFEHVMENHGMSYEQYNSVKDNLIRYGLLEVEVKDNVVKDIGELERGINKLVSYIKHVDKKGLKRAPKVSTVKVKQKTKERIKLSKFGRDFYEFFT